MDKIQDFEVNSPRWLSLEDFEGEVWKDIIDYEGWYQVSNMGRIKSLDRWIEYAPRIPGGKKSIRFQKGTIIKASIYGQYLICHLKKNNKSKAIKFHRLVCSTFHPNPHNLPEVNHINELKSDNRADNLEWCTRLYNSKWGTARLRSSLNNKNHPNKSKPVYQYSMRGKLLFKYPSIKEATRQTGIKESNIVSVCIGGKSLSAGGFLWSFSSNVDEIQRILKRKTINRPRKGRTVNQYTLDGQFVASYVSASEASRQTGICKITIINVCNHVGYQKTAGGFKWKFNEE